jgi:hypothetical protein
LVERALESGWLQESVAHRRDNKISDQGIGTRQCLLDADCTSAISNVQFCRDFLIRQ